MNAFKILLLTASQIKTTQQPLEMLHSSLAINSKHLVPAAEMYLQGKWCDDECCKISCWYDIWSATHIAYNLKFYLSKFSL